MLLKTNCHIPIRVTASSLNIHALTSFGHQSNSSSPFPGAVIDFINLIDGPHPTGSHNSSELTALYNPVLVEITPFHSCYVYEKERADFATQS